MESREPETPTLAASTTAAAAGGAGEAASSLSSSSSSSTTTTTTTTTATATSPIPPSTPPPPPPPPYSKFGDSHLVSEDLRSPMKRDRAQALLEDSSEELNDLDQAGPSNSSTTSVTFEPTNIASLPIAMALPETLPTMVSEWNLPEQLCNYFYTRRINELQTWQLECLHEFMVPKDDFPNLIYIGENASYPGQNTIMDITLFTHLLDIKKELQPEEAKKLQQQQQQSQPQQHQQPKKVLIIEPSIVAVRRRLHELGGVLADLNLRIESLVVCGNVKNRLDRCDVVVCTEQSALTLIERLQLPKTLSGTEQCESGAAAVNKFPFTMVQVERIDRLVDTAQPVPSRHQSVPNCLELLFSTWRWLEGRGHAVPLFVGRSLDLDDSVITRICDWMRARFVRPPQRAPQIIKQTMFDDIKVYNNSTIANWYNRSPILRTEPIPKHDDLILQGKENAIIHNLVKGNQCILVVPEEIVVRQMNDWFKMIEALLNHVEGDDENDWRMVYPGIYVDAYSVTHLRDMFMGRASDEENALHFDDNQLVKYGVYSIGVYMEDMSCDDTLRMESAFNRGDLRLLIASERMLQIHLARMQAPVVVIEQLKNDLDAPSYLWDLALSTEQIYLMTDDFLHGAELFATRELAMRKEPNLLLPPLTEDLTKTISGKQPLNALDRVVMHAIHIEGWTTPDLIKEYLCHTFSSHPINETLEAEGDRFIKATLNKLARFLTSEPEKPKEGEPAFYKLNAPGLLWFMTQIDRDLDEEITNSRVFHYDNKNDLAAFYYLIPRWFLDEPYIETAGRRDEFARPHEFPTDVMLARKDLMAMLLQHQMHVDDEGDSDINLKRRTFTLILDELLNRYKYEHELTDELELLTGYQERLRISVATQAQAFYIYVSLKGWTFLANYLDNLIDRLYFIIPAQSISLFQLSAMSTWLAYLLIDYEITDPQKFLTADETVMEKIFDDLRIKWFNRPHKLFNRVRQEALLWSMRQSNCAEAKSKKAKLDDGDEANKSLDEPDNENSFGSISLDYLDKDELDELLIHQQQWQQLLSQQRQQNGEDRYSQPKVGPLNVMGDQPIEPRDIASIFYDVDDKKDEKQKEDEAKKTQSTSDAAAAGPSTSKVVKPKASEPAPEPTQAPMPEKNLLGKNFDFVRFLKNFLKPNESTSEQVHVKLPFKNPNTQISAPKYYNWQLLRYGKLHVDYMVLDTVYQINKDLEPMFQALNEERQPTIAIHFEFVPKASATKRVIGLFSHMNKAEEPKGLEVGVSGRVLKTIYLQPLNTNQLFIVQGVAALEALRAIFFERARVLTAVEDDNDIMYFDSKMKRLSIVAYDMKLAATVLHDGFGFDRTYMLQHMSWYDLVTALWLLDPTSKPFELDSFNTVELNTMSMRYKMNPMFYKALFQAGGSRKDCPNKGQLLALALSHIVFGIIDNLVARKVYNVYRTIEAPIKISMFNVEKYGVTINNGYLSDLIDKMRAVKDYLEELIFQQVGYRFNLSSSKEVAQVLHKQLGYLMSFYAIKKDTVAGDANTSFGAAGNSPRGSKKKEEFDLKKLEARKMPKYLETSKVALRKLADMAKNKSNLPQLIIEYRKVTHCLSAILEPIRIALFTQSMELSGTNKAMSIETRGALKLDVKFNEWTATGRIAMHEPNLISIPKAFEVTTLPEQVWEELNKTGVPIEISTTEMGRVAGKVVMRKLVTAREGFCLVSADYSQLELRILANLAKEKTLCDLLNTQNEDVFKLIAAAWRNLKPEDVDYETRQQAKQICYGLIYGMGNEALAESLGTEPVIAEHFRHEFTTRFPDLGEYVQQTVDEMYSTNQVTTVTGRSRLFEVTGERMRRVIAEEEKMKRQAFNTKIQGSAADLTKMAILCMERAIYLDNYDAHLILQLYDELIYEVRLQDAMRFAHLLREQMENVGSTFDIRLVANLKVGLNWGDMAKVE